MTLLGNLFTDVSPQTVAAWNAARRSRSFAPGEQLLAMGEVPPAAYEIRSGRAKLSRTSRGGQALTLFYAAAGDIPGLIPICKQAPTIAFVTAVSRLETFAIPASIILKLVGDDPKLAANIFTIATNQLYALAERLDDIGITRIEQKISRALLRLVCEHARQDGEAFRVDVSRQDLADLIGSTHYTVSRVLSEWDRQGMIVSGRGNVVIRDFDALAAVAEG